MTKAQPKPRICIYLAKDVLKAFRRYCLNMDIKQTVLVETLVIEFLNKKIREKKGIVDGEF